MTETEKELYFENESRKHQIEVARCLSILAKEILERATTHDNSKLEEPERSIFAENTAQLTDLDYGSDEYNDCLLKMKVALDHHYFTNRHHPQYHGGVDLIQGMNLVDLLEMIADWYAATQRHASGNINKSIDINEKRFGLTPQLTQVLMNTVKLIEGEN